MESVFNDISYDPFAETAYDRRRRLLRLFEKTQAELKAFGSLEESPHTALQNINPIPPEPIERLDYSFDVSLENITNTELRPWVNWRGKSWYLGLGQKFVKDGRKGRKIEELTYVICGEPFPDFSTSTEFKRTEDFSSGEKEFYLAGSVNSTVVEALPDTGAEACFISPHLTSRLGLHPAPGSRKRITLANKKVVKSPGMVTVPWTFTNEQITHTINCWILPGCTSDLVLGNGFLKATNALKKVCHRIKSKFFGVSRRLSLSYLGNEKQRLRGYLNGHSTAALADTGSDAMFINGAYARRIGLDIDSDVENQVQVRLADGSTIMTSGMVRDINWEVGKMTVQCMFYVLENLCVDVILSKNYLFEKNIFSEQEEHFFDINSEDDSEDDHDDGYGDYILHFCILSIDTKVHAGILTLQGKKEQEKLEELCRRDRARDKIMALPEDQREAATKIENAQQQLWEAQKSEREAKWIAELHTVAGNVQHSVTRRSRWKNRISFSFLMKGSRR
ncbi:hypothetical protein H0G86_010214 [Trichoderma simmonsii]|uniref:Peptidase A2 domain-containing protein n=1 Tax=Trichoderma simmonsii TaxID=1491479 RepID=A0A8G0LKY7_9HYPO|nr:hypothetical protein H0G86_010214 [Trichoderma simmonsii]